MNYRTGKFIYWSSSDEKNLWRQFIDWREMRVRAAMMLLRVGLKLI